jgi:light-regulated signal transduction histidine kinase (bacteriophytochrome)
MSDLIDDLLNLSRVSRREVTFEQINMSELIELILKELRQKDMGREADFSILPGIIVTGDGRLLKIALENLLNNAWKFTSKNNYTRIEFGLNEEEGKKVYFIRDNGAGFNMNYANKIFAPFQRFHSTSEFSGTGIGLATVQRIIYRHGGLIWASSNVGEGSTFYFTIGT